MSNRAPAVRGIAGRILAKTKENAGRFCYCILNSYGSARSLYQRLPGSREQISYNYSKLATTIANKLDIDSDIEYSMVKIHSEAGYNILKSIDFEGNVAEIVYQHHERMDGSGYPRQLKGEQILKEARILCVADVVEAMMSHRPYRPALGVTAALEEIEQGAGTIYDADCVNICLKLFRDEGFSFLEVIIDAI